MEVAMRIGPLLGAAAAFVAVAGAQAADMPVKAKPVQYVKICSLYGDGFYYIPGTDTCLKLGGFLRVQTEYKMGAGGSAAGNGTTMSPQGRFDRADSNDVNYRNRAVISWDVRQQTEYGMLRAFIRFGGEITTPAQNGAGTAFSPYWDRAFLQFAGFTVGKTLSFFDLFTYSGVYAYHDPRPTGDTTISNGNIVWGYTAEFGNDVTGTLSLEDPAGHSRVPVVDATVPGFFAVNGVIVGDNAFSQQNAAANGFRMPDTVVNLRIDQPWGFAGISGVVHDASGAYYGTPNVVTAGHPADRVGWAAQTGGMLNLPGGDMVGVNFCYGQGAVGYCTRQGVAQVYNASTSVGVGWIADGVFAAGTEVELTRVWSALAAYEHIWNARWKTSVFGGYASIDYNSNATGILNSALVAGSVCARPIAGLVGNLSAVRADPGNSCNPDYSFYEIGTRTQFNPVPQLDIGFEVLYTHHNTAYKGPALYTVNASRPAVTLIDDQNVWSAFFRWQRNFYP
jgi:hypothetical protein